MDPPAVTHGANCPAKSTQPLTWVMGALIVALHLAATASAQAYTPDSPEVRRMIDNAKSFLSTKEDRRAGGLALQALVFVKDDEPDHPLVQKAVEAATSFTSRPVEDLANLVQSYESSLIAIFLSELDAYEHEETIKKLLASLWARQREHGGFGYMNSSQTTGDTSMTQYVVLAAWTAFHTNPDIELDWQAIEDVCNWLIRTQDPSGAWGYQGNDPGPNAARVAQTNVRLSLAAGGLGSVYVCADLLGGASRLRKMSTTQSKLPTAFRPVLPEAEEKKSQSRGSHLSPTLLTGIKRSLVDGNRYFANNFAVPAEKHNLYYIYGLERYKSFFEQLDGGEEVNPDWYDRCVAWLLENQDEAGSWKGDEGPVPDTAFATLFLLRSTQKSIKASLGEGLLTGGRGLPKDTSKIRLKRGKIVAQPLTASPDEIMAIMEDPHHVDFGALADNPESVLLSLDPGKQAGQLQRLRRLVQSGSAGARRLAVQALSQTRDFSNVPVLIYALGDEDFKVVNQARDALRFVSRKFDGFGMPKDPTSEEQQAAITQWKQWYRSIRPGAQFIE